MLRAHSSQTWFNLKEKIRSQRTELDVKSVIAGQPSEGTVRAHRTEYQPFAAHMTPSMFNPLPPYPAIVVFVS